VKKVHKKGRREGIYISRPTGAKGKPWAKKDTQLTLRAGLSTRTQSRKVCKAHMITKVGPKRRGKGESYESWVRCSNLVSKTPRRKKVSKESGISVMKTQEKNLPLQDMDVTPSPAKGKKEKNQEKRRNCALLRTGWEKKKMKGKLVWSGGGEKSSRASNETCSINRPISTPKAGKSGWGGTEKNSKGTGRGFREKKPVT